MKLKINGISKNYGRNKALIDFSAELEPGIYALLGPNGSGKSTLMNILTDNLSADSGEILFEENGKEENILAMGARFRSRLGFMPQYPGMYPNFSAEEFLWYIATLKDMGAGLRGKEKKAYIKSEIEKVLSEVELLDVAERKIGAFSGGMKQRLCLAQAVLGNPSVLILDEPTAGLDPKQRIAVRNFISRIAFDKIVIIATHVVSDIEYIAKSVIMLKKGVICDNAPVSDLLAKMQGKVWLLPCEENEVDFVRERFRVVNILKGEGGKAVLRIISDTKPFSEAKEATPALEDYYIYVFGTII